MRIWPFVALCLGLVPSVDSQQLVAASPCGQAFNTRCASTYVPALQNAGSDREQLCLFADAMVGCAAEVTSSCDVIETAEVLESVRNLVINRVGLQSPQACPLPNSSLPVYNDPCNKGLTLCFVRVLARAEISRPLIPATVCLFYEGFKRCVGAELSACSSTVLQLVQRRAEETKTKFNDKYSCDQRKGAVKLHACVGTLNTAIQRLASVLGNGEQLNRDLVCQEYKAATTCVEEAKAVASESEKVDTYDQQLSNKFPLLLRQPLYCQAENPCLFAVQECNSSRISSVHGPCDLLPIYDDCLGNHLRQCDQGYQNVTLDLINAEKKAIKENFFCEATAPSISAKSQDESCDAVAATCRQRLTDDLEAARGYRDAICQAAEDLLTCVIEGSVRCKPVAKTELVRAVQPVVRTFSDPEFTNCRLSSASHPLLQQSACGQAVVNCSSLLFQAEEPDPTDLDAVISSCLSFDAYVECTQKNLGQCDDVILDAVGGYVINATHKFSGKPYYCSERRFYDIETAQQKFDKCQDAFESAVSDTEDVNIACESLGRLSQCVTEATATASPRLQRSFNDTLTTISRPYLGEPFFCASDNPCNRRFQSCADAAVLESISVLQNPCGMIPVLKQCLEEVSLSCRSDHLATTARLLTSETDLIDRQNGCSHPATNATTSKSPTNATSTTTSKPQPTPTPSATARPATTKSPPAQTATASEGTEGKGDGETVKSGAPDEAEADGGHLATETLPSSAVKDGKSSGLGSSGATIQPSHGPLLCMAAVLLALA